MSFREQLRGKRGNRTFGLARISVVVCGARVGDGAQAVSGHVVLADECVAPSHPSPLVIRDVLVQECQSVRDQGRAVSNSGAQT